MFSILLPLALSGAAPVPIIAGAVRDQFGNPIAGARIQAGRATVVSEPDGTFALISDASSVHIDCDFCRPLTVQVTSDGTVAAIVYRYAAVQDPLPNAQDVRSMPYARAESLLSLQPYAMLLESSRALPGPRVSLFGASRFGGLLIDNGIPSYDSAAGATPLRNIPGFDTAAIGVLAIDEQQGYGDLAGGGVFLTQTPGSEGFQSSVIAGSERAAQVAGAAGPLSLGAAVSQDALESSARVDAGATTTLGGGILTGNVFGTSDAYDEDYGHASSSDSSMSAARLHVALPGSWRPYVELVADRAGYLAAIGSTPISALWSDAAVQSGVASNTPVRVFADAGLRSTSGFFDGGVYDGAPVAGREDSAHVDAGLESAEGKLQWRAAAGLFDVRFSGGSLGTNTPLHAVIAAPSFELQYDLSPQWRVEVSGQQSFRLPAFAEIYTYGAVPGPLPYDAMGSQLATLEYTDLRRVRVGVAAFHENVSNLDTGSVRSAGAYVDWQIAPALSVRAWSMNTRDTTEPSLRVYRYGAAPQSATPGSYWLSYRTANGITADVLWRRDLLGYATDAHVDASLTGPIAGDLRWFAGDERRAGIRYFSIGLRESR